MIELYSCNGVKDLPGGPFELSDFKELKGLDKESIIESFFPNLNDKLKREVLSAVEEIHKAWRKG